MKMRMLIMKISQQGSEVFFCHMFFILPNLLNLKLAMTQIESYFQFSVACTFRFCFGKCLVKDKVMCASWTLHNAALY